MSSKEVSSEILADVEDSPSEESDEDVSHCLRAYLVVFGSFLGYIANFGYFNSLGAVQSYLNLHQMRDVPNSQSSFIFSVFLLIAYCWTNGGGVYYDVLGPRPPMIIGTILTFFGIFFTGDCHTVGQFIGVYGVVTGVGLGFLSGPLAGTINSWFYNSDRASTAFALATVGGSVGGIIFPLILNRLYIVVGFRWALRIVAIICLVMLVIATILCVDCKETRTERKTHVRSFKEFKALCIKIVDFRPLYKEPVYLLCTLGVAFCDVGLTLTLTYFPTYVTFRGYSETRANTCITIFNCLGIVGRWVPGLIADKIGPFNVMMFMISISTLSIYILWLAWSLSSVGLISIYLFAVVYGFFNSSVLSLAPSCVASVSPKNVFGQRYGTAYFIAGLFVFGGLTGGGVMINNETTSNFRAFAVYCGVLYTCSLVAYALCRFILVGKKVKVYV